MASKTQIVNIAMARIGASKQLANVDTDTSREAIMARTFFDDDVKFVLRDFPWPWATSYADLAVVAGSTTTRAIRDWQYSYRYPSDCLYVRRLVVDGIGRDDPNPAPYSIGRDSQGRLIYTDEPTAQIEYTVAIDDTAEFDPMFVSMLAWKVGSGLAPALSKIKGMAESCISIYEIEKTKAEARALNEAQQSQPLEAETIRARD